MAGFDKARFAEAFAAALLGAAAHDYLRGAAGGPSNNFDVVRKFQRGLLLAASMPGFTEDVSTRYLGRIAQLTKAGKKKYLRQVLQPSESFFDERMTSLVIFDHALQPDVEWTNTTTVYQVDEGSVENPIMSGAKVLSNWADNHAKKREAEYERRRNSGFWGRVGVWIDKLL